MNDYNFGNFVCMLRENKGLTQQEVADMLGVTPAAVSKWENGSSKPRVEVLFKLAEILGVRSEELMAGRYLDEETVNPEAARLINERYEYLSKIESYASTKTKLKRLASSFIDFLIAAIFIYLTTLLVYRIAQNSGVSSGTEAAACVSSFLITAIVFLGFHDFIGFGRSLGKRIMRLTVLDKKTGEKATTKQKLLRNAVTTACMFIAPFLLCVDVLVMLVRGQSIGDGTANTVVVELSSIKDEGNDANANDSSIIQEQGNTTPSSDDIQKINTYIATPTITRRFAIGLISVLAVIVISVLVLFIVYLVNYDSYEIVSTDITQYEQDCLTYQNASLFMPTLESLTDYTDISYSHKTMVYSSFMGFASDGLALFVQYDESVYGVKKTELLNSYTFLEEPVFDGDYELPVTEFFYKNYQMKVVPDENYIDYSACKSFALIGFDDVNKRIVYCYHYSFDLDFIAELGEDLELEMHKFMNNVFYFKEE